MVGLKTESLWNLDDLLSHLSVAKCNQLANSQLLGKEWGTGSLMWHVSSDMFFFLLYIIDI